MTECYRTISLHVIAVIIALSCAHAKAADVSVGTDVNSAYVYHGLVYNDGMVFQPWLDVSKHGCGINVWANMDIDDFNGTLQDGEFSEVDLSVYYSTTAVGLDWTLTYAEYLFPHVANSETNGALDGVREVILKAERNIIGGFSAYVKLQYDIDDLNDLYARLGLSYVHGITDKMTMGCSVDGAYSGDKLTLTGKGGLNDYNLSLKINYNCSDTLSIGGNIGYTGTLDKDVLPEQDVDFLGGISISAVL